ncbi:hypothetical protein BKH43_03935 [Helicobacter sp. 13S00401-1]|uniref:glycerate kinase n=1 Tax=Helicobacter sp. 13S00401-1 TaxID=1905758 RepID=UPI000BA5A384|nr:glycerate kinase [Helicobacter sp. 13S00401-1]PAF50721.1 hypothetical protein BKH43_03935 [Helicobacter sp. 13S00401-1]
MKTVIIATDSFKGSLSSLEATKAIMQGLLQNSKFNEYDFVFLPIADGGEGSLDALVKKEQQKDITVSGPLSKLVKARLGFIDNKVKEYDDNGDLVEKKEEAKEGEKEEKIAVIESAEACGLTLLKSEEKNPMLTTTYGVGEMIAYALKEGATSILLTIGGTASNDGGAGMLAALGAKFYDNDDKEFIPTGGTLIDIKKIDISSLNPLLKTTKIEIACDVTNPLLGSTGATYIFSPQKGATKEMLPLLESGMEHYAHKLAITAGVNIKAIDITGSGAGGGLPASLLAFCKAELRSGIDCVLDALNFDSLLKDAKLIITGEGCLDTQSINGKAVSGVARRAKAKGVPVVVLAGSHKELEESVLRSLGIVGFSTIIDIAKDQSDAMANAAKYLSVLAKKL